jgi:hypothetical protein
MKKEKNNPILENYKAFFLEVCNKSFDEILREIKDQNLIEKNFCPQKMEINFVVVLNNEEQMLRVVCNPKIEFLEKE